MIPAEARTGRNGRTGRAAPLSAATLLLLVTMVLASSPAAPRAAFVHPADPRPVPTGTLTVETESDWVSHRRKARTEEQQAATAWWRTTVRSASVPSGQSPARPFAGEVPASYRIRPALLDLPPPVPA
jgi:hypothetical protein